MASTADLDTFVETRMIDVADLHEYPGNARRGNIPELKASLERHGQYRAIIVQDRGADGLRVLAGNHTFQALKELGRGQVRCEVHVMDDDLARRVVLADNRQAELGTNDTDALLELLGHMDGDFDGLGYVQDDVDRLLETYVGERDDPAPRRAAPEEFPSYDDDLDTEYCCPKCSYEWSGKPR